MRFLIDFSEAYKYFFFEVPYILTIYSGYYDYIFCYYHARIFYTILSNSDFLSDLYGTCISTDCNNVGTAYN